MKATCISPMARALSVCWYIQMVRPNWLMLLASTETIWPSQTTMKALMPVGRLEASETEGSKRGRSLATSEFQW